MPSRVIRGEIVNSESLARVSEGAELVFYKLLNVVDDYGRYLADPEILAAHLYPRRRCISSVMMEERLQELANADGEEAGPIHLYWVDGKRYVWLVNHEKHRSNQKRGRKSRWPLPNEVPEGILPPADWKPEPKETGDPQTSESSADPHGSHGDPTGVTGCRGDEVSRLRGVVQEPSARSARTPKGQTDPPQRLTDEEREKLQAWAWNPERLLNSDFAQLTAERLLAYEEACLDWFRGAGKRKKDWPATVRSWIRKDLKDGGNGAARGPPKGRLERIADNVRKSEERDRERAQQRERKAIEAARAGRPDGRLLEG